MAHLGEGEIRAYLDRELAEDHQLTVQSHLDNCPRCQEKVDLWVEQARRVESHLNGLGTGLARNPIPVVEARKRLSARLSQKETEVDSMSLKLIIRRYRLAWIALAVVLLLIVSMAFAPVRAIANSFLGIFRVQQIAVVQVNPGNLPEQLGASSQFEEMFSKDVKFERIGETHLAANAAEAAQQAGISLRLPAALSSLPNFEVQAGGLATFTVDAENLQALLDEIGRSDIHLPKNLDGSVVKLDVPVGVTTQYGDCKFDLDKARQEGYDPDDQQMPRLPDCTILMQMPSPTITAPPGLDVAQIGQAFLQIMGLSQEEAARFTKSIDWTTTLVIPIPSYGAEYQEVQVDGVTGVFLSQAPDQQEYLLFWVNDNMVYALTGPGNLSRALQIANSLK